MGHFLKVKRAHSPLNQPILSSTRVPFTFMTVQVPNLALTYTKRITVYGTKTVHRAMAQAMQQIFQKNNNMNREKYVLTTS